MSKISSKFSLTAMVLSVIGLGNPAVSNASPIEPGFDLFETVVPGTYINLGCAGDIPLEGNPALLASEGIGPTDTIVERKAGISSFPDTIAIELVALSLKSINSFDGTCLGLPSSVDLYVTINALGLPDLFQPDALPASTGTMTIRHENTDADTLQGTFDSTLNVNSDLIFVVPGGDVNNPGDRIVTMVDPQPFDLTSTGSWTHTVPSPDHHNAQYPAGNFYIPPGNACDGGPCIVHTGPHTTEPTLVTLVENSFIATAGLNITWETASEVDNAGFFIWRGQLKAGKTECSLDLNVYAEVKRIEPFIQAQGAGAPYSYFDSQVASGNSYCYALEDLDLADKSTFHLDDLTLATMP
ncbi:MAG: hypothetical protein ABFS56_34180 [Pseudomonadota bacterium]